MQVTYVVVVAIITYVLGALTKLKWNKVPNKFIPLQNVIIAIISTLICFFTKLEPNFIQAFVLCFMATMGAGGMSGLVKTFKKEETNNNLQG